ncbi:MAG TPA: calcium-binding protein, partial [Sphingomicrobium sp.]
GGDFFDIIIDGAGNDTVTGGLSFDRFQGSAGNDRYDGAAPGQADDEYDEIDYSNAVAGIVVDLGAASNNVHSVGNGDAAGIGVDQLTNIEGVIGTAFADTMTGDSGGNFLDGSHGDDIINGAGGNDELRGWDGNDTIDGGDGDDEISGDWGADTINGGAGDDFISDGTGSDTVHGGAGSDEIHAGIGIAAEDGDPLPGNDIYDGGSGAPGEIDTVSYDEALAALIVDLNQAVQVRSAGAGDAAGIGTDQLIGIEAIVGSQFGDVMIGDSGDNILHGDDGNDTFTDGAGNDAMFGDRGADTFNVSVGAGNDFFDGGADFFGDTQDLISFGQALAGVAVDLTAGTAHSVVGDAAGIGNDTLANIEIVTGSAFDDQITGSDVANTLFGANGNDILSGMGGNDFLSGGAGDDTLDGGSGVDRVSYTSSSVGVTVSLAVAGPQNTGQGMDTLIGIENITGSLFNDVLTGNASNNSFTGSTGADVMTGGAGNDTYNVDSSDTVVENANEGIDTVISGQSFTLGANVENLILGVTFGPGGPEIITRTGTGNDLDNEISGTDQGDILIGMGGNDTLMGNGGPDYLDGGAGADTMTGGFAPDTYVIDDVGDVIQGEITGIDFAGDTVISSISYQLNNVIENLTLTGTADIDAIGNFTHNRIIGNDGNNILTGGGGNDVLTGGGGVDTFRDFAFALDGNTITDLAIGEKIVITDATLAGFSFSLSGDTLTYTGGSLTLQQSAPGMLVASAAEGGGVALTLVAASEGDDTINGTAQDDVIVGLGGNDALHGLGGNDSLEGGAGNDTLDGGNGFDTASYAGAASAVTVNLALFGGQDTVGAGTDTFIDIENVAGSGFNDTLTGNAANNVIEGRAGDDVIDGAAGTDTASYASAGSAVVVNLDNGGAHNTGGAGIDTLISIENVTGSAFGDTLTGDAGANLLSGLAGNDVLNGGAGADALIGGTGNDQFYIDNYGDSIVEAAGEGDDVAFVLGTYTLAQGVSVETLVALNQSSTDPLVLTGNEFGQSLYGNLGDNYLNGGQGADYLVGLAGNDNLLGGTGADHMQGGIGDDVYYVDEAGDLITELAGEGNDILVATASYTLAAGASIETMSAEQTNANINLTGNELAQSLYGNGGNNILTGGGGADYMVGGAGNDVYYVDTSDFIGENIGGGDDTIVVATSYTLREGNEIETLVALNQDSVSPVDLTGNEFGQSLYGSQGVNNLNGGAGNDYLVGLGGNDFLIGGAGNDNLQGGTGNDLYYVDGGDQIFETAGEGDDLAVAFASFALGAGQSVETLTAAEGNAAINLTGNALAQSIYGNAGANILTTGGGADYMVGGAGNDVFVLTNAAGVATVGDYAAGDVVDITQFLSVAGGTNVVSGGYVRIVGTSLQVDANGGGDGFVTVGTVSGSGSVTIRYQSGGTPTDLGVARSAGQEAQSEAIVAKTALVDGHAPVLDNWHGLADTTDGPFDPFAHHLDLPGII